MEIHFDNEKFKQCCNEHKRLVQRYGTQMAKVIRRRLDDLDAAETLDDLKNLPGRCHELLHDRADQLSLDLVHPKRLIFKANDKPVPRKPDGGLDWGRIKSVLILDIEDTHE